MSLKFVTLGDLKIASGKLKQLLTKYNNIIKEQALENIINCTAYASKSAYNLSIPTVSLVSLKTINSITYPELHSINSEYPELNVVNEQEYDELKTISEDYKEFSIDSDFGSDNLSASISENLICLAPEVGIRTVVTGCYYSQTEYLLARFTTTNYLIDVVRASSKASSAAAFKEAVQADAYIWVNGDRRGETVWGFDGSNW